METLKQIVKSKLFKDFLKVLVAFLSGYASSGCALVASVPPAVARFECQLAVLEQYVPRAAAEDIAMAARAGNAPYVVQQLLSLDVSPADIQRAAEAFSACSPPEPPPAAPPALTRS